MAQSSLLELTSEELEEQLEEEAGRNPALVVVRRVEPGVPSQAGSVPCGDDDVTDLADWLAAPTSGRVDLLAEFRRQAPDRLHAFGEALVSALDERAYFRGDLEDLAVAVGVSLEDAEEALALLQSLDPPGLGARTLAECLSLQLQKCGDDAPAGCLQFVEQCLDGGPGQMGRTARALLGLSEAQVQEIVAFLRDHTRPYAARLVEGGSMGADPAPPPAVPDVILERHDGRLVINVPQSQRLQVRIDRLYTRIEEELRYRRRLAEHEREVRENVRAARELIKLLQRRQETLAAVAEAIVAHQSDYFVTGDPQRLRPLDQKTIARATGLHESTVCRALRRKHVLMPDLALVPFELFFDDALPARLEIRRLVNSERPDKPYSDEQLAHLMAERGYPIARRTVTKYRLQMGLAPAHGRKRAQRRKKAKKQAAQAA